MNEFRERRLKGERGYTPKEVLEDVLKEVDNIKSIAVIYETEDGIVENEYSTDNPVYLIGLIEMGKSTIIESWYE